jgi:putative ABC transport system substrate-binding protein
VLPRWGGNVDSLAQDLASAKPDVIVAVAPRAISAAMKAAPQIPIIASFTTDPVIEGEAASISRPGGQVTGIALLTFDGDKKRMELLHDAIPGARKFAFLADALMMTQHKDMLTQHKEEYRQTAEKIGIELVRFEVKSPADYQQAFDAIHNAGVDGIVMQSSPNFHRDAAQLATLALERRLPTICEWRAMASDGCLIGYGPNIAELRLRTADFVAKERGLVPILYKRQNRRLSTQRRD